MYEREKKQLIETLRTRGISDESVIQAFNYVPRHLFVPKILSAYAYTDNPLPIGQGQTISQPYTVAFMTEKLEPARGLKVLEIGTGSGYQAAILAALGMQVYSIERSTALYNMAQTLFDQLSIQAVLKCGDGTLGWKIFAPYDRIIVTAGAPIVPEKLIEQLSPEGIMVIPVGDRQSQTMKKIRKQADDDYTVEDHPYFSFVPLIGREGWKTE